MLPIPDDILKQFNAVLEEKTVSSSFHDDLWITLPVADGSTAGRKQPKRHWAGEIAAPALFSCVRSMLPCERRIPCVSPSSPSSSLPCLPWG